MNTISRSRRHLAGLLVALALLPATPVRAAPQVIAPAATQIELESSRGRLIRLGHPASSIFVADPDIADIQVKSPTLIYLVGKAAGVTTLYAVDGHDNVIMDATVTVKYDAAKLQQLLKKLVPDAKVSATFVDDSVVLSGTVFSAAEAEDVRRIAARFVPDQGQIVNKVQIEAANQINLRVRVAEMSRDTIKQFGINWEGVGGTGNFLFGLATGNPVLATGTVLPSSAPKSFITRSNGANSITGSFSAGRVDLNTLVDALEREGLVSVLAEPNLTALSGEPASFLAGGEFPIPVPQQNGVTTVDYKKFGVSLSFSATIGARDRISLKVRPEVSQLSSSGSIVSGGITVPALTTRRAETTVELGSGQSFAIAGLLQNNVSHDISKFPWLGDVPVLGQLFRSDRFQRNETELVIIVTPYVVRPVSDKRLAAPNDGYVAPSDADRIVSGADHRPQLKRRGAAPASRKGGSLVGPVGFELD